MTTYDNFKLGEKIRKIRLLKNLTREQVAAELNLSVKSYANIENDETNTTVKRIFELATIFNCEITEIFEFKASNYFNFKVTNNEGSYTNINHLEKLTNDPRLLKDIIEGKNTLIKELKSINDAKQKIVAQKDQMIETLMSLKK